MNPPTDYQRIAVDVGKEQKRQLLKHTQKTGQGVSFVVRKLIALFLAGKVNING